MAQGTGPEHTRAYNRRAILQVLHLKGAASRADLARHTGLSLQAISNIVAALVDDDVVIQGQRRVTRRGQPPIEFRLNPEGAYSLGFSVDQHRLSGLLLNLVGEVVAQKRLEVRSPSPTEALSHVQSIVEEFSRALPAEEWGRVRGLGLSLPGVIEEKGGRVARMVRLPEWEGLAVGERLERELEMRVYVANDAASAAVGELWHGHGRSVSTFFYVLFGLGLGSSLILDGAPPRSIWNVSGRMGHIPVEPRGRTCPACGETGCLSLYTSLEALLETLHEGGVTITAKNSLADLYREGNEHLLDWLESAALYFTRALVVLENLLDPEAFVFGGELPAPLLEHLIAGIRRRYDERSVRLRRHGPAFLPGHHGLLATAFGAATLPVYLGTSPRYELVLST